jgi:hypothetical protein
MTGRYRKRVFGILLASAMILFAFGPSVIVAHAASWLEKATNVLQNVQKSPGASSSLSDTDISAGLRDALRVGTQNVVGQLGRVDGFDKDAAIHIPLPQSLKTVQSVLGPMGMGAMLDDLELRLNRAAEAATPKAKELFMQSIKEMTITDARNILQGPDDAATRYFQKKMGPPLADEMTPVVKQSLAQAGAVQAFDQVMGKYRSVPLVPDVKTDLTHYVVEKAMDGIFHYLAIQEADIRRNPVKRTTDLLKKVFGQ